MLTVTLALLCACSAEVQPYREARGLPAWGYTCLTVGDGVCLPYRFWKPAEGEAPKAVLIALHGLNDYSRAFDGAGAELAEQGIWTLAYDQRGFGANCRPGVWPGTENLVADAGEVAALVRARFPGVPVYVLGESMGGAVVTVAAARGRLEGAEGLILLAPALWGGDEMSQTYRRALALMMATAPRLSFSGRGLGRRASDNLAMLWELGADPLFLRATRVDVIHGLVGLMDEAHGRFPALNRPTLLLYGKRDQIVPVKVFEAWEKADAPWLSVIAYDDGWHMLLRDVQAARAADDIAAWIRTERKH